MKKYFAVSDIHSFYSQLKTALNSQGFDRTNPEHMVIVCGDLFDRGDSSIELFSWTKELASENRLIYIRGNHEDLLESCVKEIQGMGRISRHHISNGTIRTLANIVQTTEYDILNRSFDWKIFDKKVNEVLNFINSTSINYFELGDVIFVHGWIPCDCNDPIIYHARKNVTLASKETWADKWEEARWLNGMMCWNQGAILEGKTIVCGHWHTSYGWANIDKKCPEWGSNAIFDPYIKKGIIALDGCVAYTNKINCVVFDETGALL